MFFVFQRLISSKVILVAEVCTQPIPLQMLCNPDHPLRGCFMANIWVDFRYFTVILNLAEDYFGFTDDYYKNSPRAIRITQNILVARE